MVLSYFQAIYGVNKMRQEDICNKVCKGTYGEPKTELDKQYDEIIKIMFAMNEYERLRLFGRTK